MIVDVSKKILIVGLGLLGGSYAKVLKRFGFHISAITLEQSSIDYAIKENIIDEGSTEIDEKMIGEADFVIFELSISLVVSPPHFVFVTFIPSSLRVCLISSQQDHHQSLKDKLPGRQSEVLTTQTAFPPKP